VQHLGGQWRTAQALGKFGKCLDDVQPAVPLQSALAPEALTTLAHLAVSARM
jgi:hypothetical protein